MPDPITTTILAAAGGAATKEIVSKTWDSGKKWLSSYFANHQPEAQQTAEQNAAAFVTDLASRIEKLEQRQPYNSEFFSKAFKEPSFSVLLQKAILNAAQTTESGKHQLLSKLVSEKLSAKEETILSLASQMACDAIAFATPNQLKILGLLSAITQIAPNINPHLSLTRDQFIAACETWTRLKFGPFLDASISGLDILHLEGLSCLKHLNIASFPLNEIVANWKHGDHRMTIKDFVKFPLWSKIHECWNTKGMEHMVPTSVGALVGIYVVDLKTGGETPLTAWNQ